MYLMYALMNWDMNYPLPQRNNPPPILFDKLSPKSMWDLLLIVQTSGEKELPGIEKNLQKRR